MASEYPFGILKLFLCFPCGTNNGFWYTANKASDLYLRRIRKKVGTITYWIENRCHFTLRMT